MRFLITAGATREYIDPVRFISNASSGRMGYAIVRAAFNTGHNVTFITTVHRASSIEHRVTIIKVETTAQMFDAVRKYFPRCDCLIMAAAVADYTPAQPAKTKIKKSNESLTIKLKPTIDILKWAGKHKNQSRVTSHGPRIIVGFALEDRNVRANAERKLRDKNLDMIIANTPAAIGADKISVLIKTPDQRWLKLPKATKTKVAEKIISLVEKASLFY